MRKTRPTLWATNRCVALCCTVALAWFLLGHSGASAQVPPPPPPPDPPTETPTSPPTDTPGPPTDTPVPPTDTPIPPTDTPVPPTDTPVPPGIPSTPVPPTATNTQSPVEQTATPRPQKTPERRPNCQSVVKGYVADGFGQRASGATVVIEGTGWSASMMTDDNAHYGFGGLCAGPATLQAFLLSGQASQPAQVSLSGQDIIRLDLIAPAAGAADATGTPSAQQSPTPAPDMPTTGYTGWLLAGGGLLGALLLLLAGTRRAVGVPERTQDHD